MRKFTIIFVFSLVLFIAFGSIGIFFGKESPSIIIPEVEAMNKAPGYKTMMDVASIVEEQTLQDAIVNLYVTPNVNEEHVSLTLRCDDIITEETLLKNSYPILLKASSLEKITSFTITWQLNDELTVMSLMLDQNALSNIKMKNFATLPSITNNYYKHTSMN
nr:hypothetical protein [Lysinibacillus timonensis]